MKRKSIMLLIVFILALTLCGTVAAANTSYGVNVANSGLFEIVLTTIAFIGIGAACSKSGNVRGGHGSHGFDDDWNDWDDSGFDGGFDGGD
ncbi:hypothetical protein [Methanobacterium sp.]|uniref:hypothetical protein n=1 Tax=Methanobacterium sp. TaxID=2164 RepID=UPI003C754E2B